MRITSLCSLTKNQRLYDDNSTIKDIQTYLGAGRVYRLTKNYRNTLPIARLAKEFYTGLASGVPDLPTRLGPKPTPWLGRTFEDQVYRIIKYARNNPDRTMGVIVPDWKLQHRAYEIIMQYNARCPVQMYTTGDTRHMKYTPRAYGYTPFRHVDFKKPGILIINYQTAKGLEFDTVFLAGLESRVPSQRTDLERMRYYVLTARARDELYLVFSGNDWPPMLKDIPRNELLNLPQPAAA